jgi:hypothetical protein
VIVDECFIPSVQAYTWKPNTKGYLYTRIKKKWWSLHRYVWFLRFGAVPKELDHVNKNKHDCRIENLRPATRKMNVSGTGRCATRKRPDLPRGVSRHPKVDRYMARLGSKYLGIYRSPEEASLVYEAALESLVLEELTRAV